MLSWWLLYVHTRQRQTQPPTADTSPTIPLQLFRCLVCFSFSVALLDSVGIGFAIVGLALGCCPFFRYRFRYARTFRYGQFRYSRLFRYGLNPTG